MSMCVMSLGSCVKLIHSSSTQSRTGLQPTRNTEHEASLWWRLALAERIVKVRPAESAATWTDDARQTSLFLSQCTEGFEPKTNRLKPDVGRLPPCQAACARAAV
eukprot:3289195-Amphidinium_carterae.1